MKDFKVPTLTRRCSKDSPEEMHSLAPGESASDLSLFDRKGTSMPHLTRLNIGPILCCLCALFLWSNPALAEGVTGTGRSTGMAEALSAGASGTAAIWHNPAGVVSSMMYAAEGDYGFDSATGASGVTASIIDTKSNPNLGLGLAFTYETSNRVDEINRDAYHARAAFGVPLAEGLLRIGSTIRYASVYIDDTNTLEAILLDAGLILQPTPAIRLGVCGFNLVNGGYDEEMPAKLGAGVAFLPPGLNLQLAGDVLIDLTAAEDAQDLTWRVGLEFLMQQYVPLRLGYQYHELTSSSDFAGGLGFRDAKSSIGLDIGFLQSIENSKDRKIHASLSLYL